MWDNLTDGACHALAIAQTQAQQLGHPYVGTDHLLVGLLCSPELEVAEQILHERGLTFEMVIAQIIEIMGAPVYPLDGDVTLALTPGAQSVVDLAVQEAAALGDQFVGTTHLLLAILDGNSHRGVGTLTLFRLLGLESEPRPNREFIEMRRRVLQLHYLR